MRTGTEGHPSPRWPGVQGLRGLAVVSVLLYHHDSGWLPGGFLGVSLFFTLSGFLITDLLLRERRAAGRIAVGRFWARRARRLAPVALSGLAVAAAVAPFVGSGVELHDVSRDLLAAALDVANWRFAFDEVAYGDLYAAPSPVTHYWSLAIEEQFYLVFPLLVVALRTERRLAAALVGLVIASVAAQVVIADANRVYLGTDTRASELAVGALLALWWHQRDLSSRRGLDGLAMAALAVVAASWATVELGSPLLDDGGFTILAGLSAVLVAGSVGGRLVPRALAWRPLVLVGDHSYGLYVFHLPLYLLLSPERTGVEGVPLLVVRLLASAAVTVAVAWAVEHPIRWQAALAGWQAPMAMATATAAVLIVAIGLPHVGSRLEPADGSATVMGGRDVPTVVTMAPQPQPGPPTTELPGPMPPPASTDDEAPPATSPAVSEGSATPVAPVAPSLPLPSPRLLVVGDSTAGTNGLGMADWAAATGRMVVDRVNAPTCTFLQDGEMIYRDGFVLQPRPACLALLDTAVEVASATPPDAVVLFIGTAQLADWRRGGSTVRTGFGSADYDLAYRLAADAALSRLEAIGVPVLLATVPVPELVARPNTPGTGPFTINDPIRTAVLNGINVELAAQHRLVELVPWAEHLDPGQRYDGVHVAPDVVADLMDAWLEADLRAAYLTASTAAVQPRLTTWSA